MAKYNFSDRHMLASIDTETTGLDSDYHEIVQIAIVPLGPDFLPNGRRPFYTTIRPEFPERANKAAFDVNGLSLDELCLHAPDAGRVADSLLEWFGELELPVDGLIAPLAHNWKFDYGFMQRWLGRSLLDRIVYYHSRDSMVAAEFINDQMTNRGLPPRFDKVSLAYLCRQLGVPLENAHDALADAIATAEVYRRLVNTEWA